MLHATTQSVDSDRLSSAGLSTHSSGTGAGGSVIGAPKRGEDDFELGPLPPMWEKAYTPNGEVYFIDHNTGTSHWLDPRLARVRKRSLGECGEDELPFGWERVQDDRYGAYYVDHINRRTQYENPVLQARRLRAEKMAAESGSTLERGGELRGEQLTTTLTKGLQGLGFTLIGGPDVGGAPELDGYLQVRSIVPHSPAWKDGALRAGDVLVAVGGRGVRGLQHAQVAQIFQSIPPGSAVTLRICRGYPLAFDGEDPNTRVVSTLAVEGQPPQPEAVAMQQLTQALRSRFNLESPSRAGSTPSREEPERSPVAPRSPRERRLMSRSFDLEELGGGGEEVVGEREGMPARCPSAEQLQLGRGRELALTLRRGAAGFGFTIADSVHGQKVKKVLDRSRCAGLREGDLLLQIGETDVAHAPHHHVVQTLKECPALHETTLRVWRRGAAPAPAAARAPRSRSATRPHTHAAPGTSAGSQLGRSKTPTAEQLRSAPAQETDAEHPRLNGEATYAVPEQKRESLMDRRRRSSTPGGRLSVPTVAPWPETQTQNAQWQDERETWLDNSNVRSWAQQNSQWQSQPWASNLERPNWTETQWRDNREPWRNDPRWEEGNRDQNWRPDLDNRQDWRANGNRPNWDNNGTGPSWDNNDNRTNWSENGARTNWAENGIRANWTENGSTGSWPNGNGPGRLWENQNGTWDEVGTPTVRVDTSSYWRGNASVADSSDNGGFPEDGVSSPSTAAVSGLSAVGQPQSHRRQGSPASSGRLRTQSPLNSTGRAPTQSPSLRSTSPRGEQPGGRGVQSPSCFTCHAGGDSPMHQPYPAPYPQVEAGGGADPEADVLVRLARGAAGFGFRIVGGTEDGSRVAVGHVVPGGPADGLLRPGDLLTSVDGVPLAGATHARAVAHVCQAAARGHVTLGVRHNRADIQPMGLAGNVVAPHPHTHPHRPTPPAEAGHVLGGAGYNIVHPAPVYPPQPRPPMFAGQYEQAVPYDVVVQRNEGEGFGFVVISSANKATSTIGQLIPNSPAARCALLHVGDTILAINRTPIRSLTHPEVVSLIKQSGSSVTLTVQPTLP